MTLNPSFLLPLSSEACPTTLATVFCFVLFLLRSLPDSLLKHYICQSDVIANFWPITKQQILMTSNFHSTLLDPPKKKREERKHVLGHFEYNILRKTNLVHARGKTSRISLVFLTHTYFSTRILHVADTHSDLSNKVRRKHRIKMAQKN